MLREDGCHDAVRSATRVVEDRAAHDNHGESNMERRKFLIGAGSTAIGSAALIGSGAVSSQQSPRDVKVDVVSDTEGTLQFNVTHSTLENCEYAEIGSDGQLRLRFDGTANSGDGLNPNSTYDFDNIFQIQNATQDHLKVDLDKSQLDNPGDITFYAHQTNGNLIGSRSNDWNGQVNSGFGVNIGMRIETPDSMSNGWESGQVVITAIDDSDQNIA